jgi:Leucine-rich repeat (LRR) protein
LRILGCHGSANGSGKLSDLSTLKPLKLTVLDCIRNPVSDLSPLKEMSLTELRCGVTDVSTLSPLKGMPLMLLICDNSKVSGLSPLKGMSLHGRNPPNEKPQDRRNWLGGQKQVSFR